jgi:anaerobic dimethyl sulfoxide reductase subunit C
MNIREWALPIYTILIQLAVGTIFIIWIIQLFLNKIYTQDEAKKLFENTIYVILLTIILALIGSHFHLSKPYLSFLSILNLKSSWLSREILFSILFFITIGILSFLQWKKILTRKKISILGWIAIFFGFSTIYSMAKIYTLPTQIAWNSITTIFSFFLSSLILGISSVITLLNMDLNFAKLHGLSREKILNNVIRSTLPWLIFSAIIILLLIIIVFLFSVLELENNTHPTAKASLSLMLEIYPFLLALRLIMTIFGVGILAVIGYKQLSSKKPFENFLHPAYFTSLLILIGEILDRFLFYAIHVRIGL